MNHYPHHIGDFNAATRHLTRVERSLYRDLMELYYDTESPLPATDFDRLARRVLADSDEEKAALRDVLNEFFERDGDVYRNTRCDAEILIYKGKIDIAIKAGKASALARAKQTLNKRRTPVERPLNERATNQEPLTTNQSLKALSGKPDAINGFKADAIEILNYLNSNAGREFRAVDANLKLIAARLKSGVTPLQVREVIFNKCQQWKSDPKMAEYLRPATLFNSTKFEQYLGELGNG